jgi:GGDEF domain-containing protein
MLLPAAVDARAVQAIGERIIAHLNRPIPWNGQECRISASIGFVIVRAEVDANPAQVMADADQALYAAKDAGRGRVVQAIATQGKAA